MKVVVIGKSGQLASELVAEKPEGVKVVALGRKDIDISSLDDFSQVIEKIKPSIIINASAYTAVDKAETDVEAAYKLNKTAIEVIAKVAKENNIRLIHVSTDFVFDGQANTAYQVSDKTHPIGVYGESKLAGENAVRAIYPDNSVIVRTSWVYSSYGSNFVKTMLKLMAEKDELSVVSDQIGCPTYAKTLANFLWHLAGVDKLKPVYHWSDSGVASWYDFAKAIQELGIEKGLLSRKIPIKAIPSKSYPTPAKRPTFSLLDISASTDIFPATFWREQLSVCMNNIKLS